ncbi:MAG TPA: hypothetical protein VKB75_10330 [Jatrophihabitans sp.]|nr:hypothetical protein [Jatrophihabitans sp.]
MTLTDGDVADLARQAADKLDRHADVRIVPSDQVDPYRWGSRSWRVEIGDRISVLIHDTDSPGRALARLEAAVREAGPNDAGRDA